MKRTNHPNKTCNKQYSLTDFTEKYLFYNLETFFANFCHSLITILGSKNCENCGFYNYRVSFFLFGFLMHFLFPLYLSKCISVHKCMKLYLSNDQLFMNEYWRIPLEFRAGLFSLYDIIFHLFASLKLHNIYKKPNRNLNLPVPSLIYLCSHFTGNLKFEWHIRSSSFCMLDRWVEDIS